MLNEIQKVEQTVREEIETAKHAASLAIQQAHTEASNTLIKLEETLRTEEASLIAKAEAEAEAEAKVILHEAEKIVDHSNDPEIKNIAHQIVKNYLI